MNKKIIMTTSWDDGDILDNRLADLLSKYGIKGTFYITKNYRPDRLSDSDVQRISKFHEIGAHTISHPDLRTLSSSKNLEKLTEEVAGSKQWLETLLGKEVPMFCYPKGFHDKTSAETVRNAGFRGARTTGLASSELPHVNPAGLFEMDTTLQVYPFPFRKQDATHFYFGKFLQPFIQRAAGLRALGVPVYSMYSWFAVAKATFEAAAQNGEVFHLWGHSWEIEKYGMWEELEKFLHYVSKNKNCECKTNGDIVSGNSNKL